MLASLVACALLGGLYYATTTRLYQASASLRDRATLASTSVSSTAPRSGPNVGRTPRLATPRRLVRGGRWWDEAASRAMRA